LHRIGNTLRGERHTVPLPWPQSDTAQGRFCDEKGGAEFEGGQWIGERQ